MGSRLGSYEILAPIGAGGMGEVYRARDTKLKREVALKVLSEAFAADPERMARFQREAEVLASLNHPNIAQIYGVEERALVMELVEGESPQGPMPLDDAWKIALQIAAGLECAHEKGIVHRDLKPANVKITPEGVVKLLDFGLAKALTAPAAPSANPDNSPTLTMNATQFGVVLGTAAYMAPEQAKGMKVDKRADIWSWGVVLYELLTGERMFKGTDATETRAQVLTKEPELERVPPQTRKLLRRCLEKDPKQRLRDIGDVPDLLEERAAAPAASRSRLSAMLPLLAGVSLLALGTVSFIYLRATSAQKAELRSIIALPEGTTNLHSFAISSDGRYLAIAAEANGKRQLWLRPMNALQAQPMAFTEDATYPFWSPDSRYLGFFAQDKLKKIAVSGGPAQTLCEAPLGRGGSWNRNDVIVFSPTNGVGAIQRISAAGGVPAGVTSIKGNSLFPVFLPDGHRFLYGVIGGSAERRGVYLSSLDGKEDRRVLADESSVVFAARRLLFIREDTLMAQPFDAAGGQTRGEASPVAQNVSFPDVNYAPATVSETGVLLYQGRNAAALNQIAWYDRTGRLLGAVGSPGLVLDLAISPDEKWVAFRRMATSPADVWLRDLTRGAERRFTTDASINIAPFWSPKGDRIVFSSNRGGSVNLYQKAASGSGQDELLLQTRNTKSPTQWSRDGRFIVYTELDPQTKSDVWVLPMEGGTARRPISFLRSEFNELQGQLSPDGHWMAYASDESGQREVYVRPFPGAPSGPEGQWKISLAGGEQPRWRGDGKELFFVGADGKMMAVAVKAVVAGRPSFEPGAPQPLFESRITQSPLKNLFEYDVTADGKRFLINTVSGPASAPVLTVVSNWMAGLKK